MKWFWFAIVQLISLVAMVLGWIALIPLCMAQEWVADAKSIKDGRLIDRWRWQPLNMILGNPEDGVSGIYALVNGTEPYMPTAWPPLRAYYWSALRNSCNNLKYVFAWKAGPYKEWTYVLLGKQRTLKVGWQMENGFNVPVMSP